MRNVAFAADGVTSKRNAPGMLAARCAWGNIAPTNTSARPNGALRARTRRALTAWPNPICARKRRRPGRLPKGGGRCLRYQGGCSSALTTSQSASGGRDGEVMEAGMEVEMEVEVQTPAQDGASEMEE